MPRHGRPKDGVASRAKKKLPGPLDKCLEIDLDTFNIFLRCSEAFSGAISYKEARMRVFIGTPEEYEKIAHLFCENPVTPAPFPKVKAAPEAIAEDAIELTPEVVERGLRRLPLSQNQRAILNAVVGASPGWINTEELAKATHLTRQQIAGVWGALGRRFANTEGWPSGKWPVKDQWDQEKSLWRYQASAVLCQLVKDGRVRLK